MPKKSKSITTDGVTFKLPTLTMTLKEITDLLEVRHDNAMRVVAKMLEEPGFGSSPQIEEMKNNASGSLVTYQLDKRQSLAVAARLSTKFLMRVIDRWLELETHYANPPRAGLIQAKRRNNFDLTNTLKEMRAEDGKDTTAVHYMSEAKLCNWALTGKFATIDETTLSNEDVTLLGKIRVHEAAMLRVGMKYPERKTALASFVDRQRTKITHTGIGGPQSR